MPVTNNPSTPQTDRSGNPERDREKQGQSSRPDQNRDTKSGRPQDDRDPNSPTRGTQRPGEPTSVDERNTSEGDESEVKKDDRGASNVGNKQRTDASPSQK